MLLWSRVTAQVVEHLPNIQGPEIKAQFFHHSYLSSHPGHKGEVVHPSFSPYFLSVTGKAAQLSTSALTSGKRTQARCENVVK